MAIPATTYSFFWNSLVLPRIGAPYVFGGAFDPNDPRVGTDCSGWVGTGLSCMVYGPANMDWNRGNNGDFSTFTFAGANPGETGPWNGAEVTRPLICIAHPGDAPADYAMIIAVNQDGNPHDAHTICRVGGIDIEMGGNEFLPSGQEQDFHTSQTNPNCNSVMDTDTFNQWFYLPGPLQNDIPDLTVAPYPGLVSAQFL